MNEILKAERLTKTYGKSIAVSEVSLAVRQGDIYGLIGKNGAGKTTFMRMVLGLALTDSGQMDLFGKTNLEHQRKHIGSLIEEPGRYPGMSARDNLEIIRRNLGISDWAVTDDMLRLVGLESAITDTGIGFAVFCDAVKNSNQRILDIESNGGLPHRSIPIGVSVTWDCYVGYMDNAAFDVRCHTFL